MNQVATLPARDAGDIMESVIVKGDLSKLSPEERSRYYGEVCRSVGLNPLTKPFEYITLNGKLTLYALRNCTDQLRQIHKVSVLDMSETERDGVYIVTCKVTNGEGRTDMAKGAVALGALKGEALCNAIMKAETKAKRRATLSICGLGWLDETEIEAAPQHGNGTARAEAAALSPAVEQSPAELVQFMCNAIDGMTDIGKLNDWCKRHKAAFDRLSPEQQDHVRQRADNRRGFLAQAPAESEIVDAETGEVSEPDAAGDRFANYDQWVADQEAALKAASDDAQDTIWQEEIAPRINAGEVFPPDVERLMRLLRNAG